MYAKRLMNTQKMVDEGKGRKLINKEVRSVARELLKWSK